MTSSVKQPLFSVGYKPCDSTDCAFPSFPPAPRSTQAAQYSFVDLVLKEHPGLAHQEIELKWCLAWGLIFGGMASTDEIVFGVIPAESGKNAVLLGREATSSRGVRSVAVHLQISGSTTIHQCETSLRQQLEGKQKACRDAMCSFQALVAVCDQLPTDDWQGNRGPSQLPLYINLLLQGAVAKVMARFDSTIIEPWLASALLERLAAVMPQLSNSDKPLTAINMMPRNEIKRIREWNSHVPRPVNRLVHEMIIERAKIHHDRVAICAWDGELTYHNMDQLSDHLSIVLERLGVKPGTLIPICFGKSIWAIVSTLAVLKAGGGFVPLDPSLPSERMHMIVQQIHPPPSLILSSAAAETLSSRICSRVLVVGQDTLAKMGDETSDSKTAAQKVSPASPAYVVFTSGSTGKPKGVTITHTSFASALYHQKDALGYSPATRFFDFLSNGFDGSIHIFEVLFSGGCVCLPRDEDRKARLAESITELRANTTILTPSVARLLDPARVPTLTFMLYGGEVVRDSDVRRWWGRVQIANAYGPSECTTLSLLNKDPKTPAEAVRIGRGTGMVTWIVDPSNDNQLLPLGCVGELLLEGPLNANYYLGDSAKTAESFIAHPNWLGERSPPGLEGVASQAPKIVYKTGDLVRYNYDGSISFIGRKDTQVKVNGFRVELGEIEHQLRQLVPNANHVIAEVVGHSGRSLAAFVVAFLEVTDRSLDAETTPSRLTTADLVLIDTEETKSLETRLPGHMVPRKIFRVPKIPVTATDKIDRKQLRELARDFSFREREQRRALKQRPEPVAADMRWLQEVWSRILGICIDDVDAETNFFHLGGTSVLAMEIVAEARAVGFELGLGDVINYPVLRDLARRACRSIQPGPNEITPFSLLKPNIHEAGSFLRDLGSQYGLDLVSIEDAYPATPLQEGLMTLSLRSPGDYIMQRVLELGPDIQVSMFRRAWEDVARRVPLLRTRMAQQSELGGFLQLVLKELIFWAEATGLQDYLL